MFSGFFVTRHIRCLSSLPKVINLNLKGNELANHTSYVKKVELSVGILAGVGAPSFVMDKDFK